MEKYQRAPYRKRRYRPLYARKKKRAAVKRAIPRAFSIIHSHVGNDDDADDAPGGHWRNNSRRLSSAAAAAFAVVVGSIKTGTPGVAERKMGWYPSKLAIPQHIYFLSYSQSTDEMGGVFMAVGEFSQQPAAIKRRRRVGQAS